MFGAFLFCFFLNNQEWKGVNHQEDWKRHFVERVELIHSVFTVLPPNFLSDLTLSAHDVPQECCQFSALAGIWVIVKTSKAQRNQTGNLCSQRFRFSLNSAPGFPVTPPLRLAFLLVVFVKDQWPKSISINIRSYVCTLDVAAKYSKSSVRWCN